jgi:transcriptional regulator with PAS, ATPase and Fis domain
VNGSRCTCRRREPPGDIPMLSFYFLAKYTALMKKAVTEISPEAMELLKTYDYPGNVRELENIIERGVAITTGKAIETAHLPDDLRNLTIHTFRKKTRFSWKWRLHSMGTAKPRQPDRGRADSGYRQNIAGETERYQLDTE